GPRRNEEMTVRRRYRVLNRGPPLRPRKCADSGRQTPCERRPSSATIRCQRCQRNPAKRRDILTNPGKCRWEWRFISLYAERVRAFNNPATRRPATPEVAGSSPVILVLKSSSRRTVG